MTGAVSFAELIQLWNAAAAEELALMLLIRRSSGPRNLKVDELEQYDKASKWVAELSERITLWPVASFEEAKLKALAIVYEDEEWGHDLKCFRVDRCILHSSRSARSLYLALDLDRMRGRDALE